MTKFHSKYYAYELSRSGGKGLDLLGRALFALGKKRVDQLAKRLEQKTQIETLFTIQWIVV